MLRVIEEYFRTDEIATLRKWASDEGAALFRRSLQGQIAKLQIEASNLLLKASPGKERFEGDAARHLDRVAELQAALSALNDAQKHDSTPFTVKVTV